MDVMEKDIERVLISQIEIEKNVQKIGAQISKDYEGTEPIFVGVLKGCFIFMADLMRHVTINCSMDFMAVSSYQGTTSTGAVKINKDLNEGGISSSWRIFLTPALLSTTLKTTSP